MGHVSSEHSAADALGRLAAVPLFGRTPLLSAVHAAFDGVREGRGHALLLLGEAGIGKTRMADEIRRVGQAAGARPIGARCHDMAGAPAFWPWIQILRQLVAGLEADERDKLLGDNAGLLTAALPDSFPVEASDTLSTSPSTLEPRDSDDRFQFFESVTALLRQAASQTPLLIVLDDLHWSDPASILLARYAIRELRRDPIVFVGLYRDMEVVPGDSLHKPLSDLTPEGEVFRLTGLRPEEVDRIVEHVAGFEVSGVLSAALHAQTGGNPLFLVEVLRLLIGEGQLGAPDAPTPEAIPLPLTVQHTLQRRLETLSPDTRATLELAAVLGSEFELEILECAMPAGSDLLGSIDDAVAARLIRRVSGVSGVLGHYGFVHDLIRETLDASVSTEKRANLHRRAADAIAKIRAASLEDHCARLAQHYLASASTGTARQAVDFARRGAARAAGAFSFELAAQLLDNALRALDYLDGESDASPDSVRTRARILIDRGHALWQSGERKQAQASHRAAAGLAQRLDDSPLLAQAAIGLAGSNDVPMSFPDASAELMEQALEALPPDDSRLRVRLLAHLVRAHYFGDQRNRLVEWAREAVAVATRLDDPSALFAAQEALHYALLVPAHLEERLFVSEQLPELARRSGSLRFEALAWLWRAFDLLQVPDIAAADAAIASFEEAAHTLRQPFYAWLAAGVRGSRAMMRGRLDEAERLIFNAFELGQKAKSPNALLFFGTQLFHLRVAQGRADELMGVMQKMVDESPALPVFRIGIPLIYALTDRREEARRSFEQVAAHDFEDVPNDLHRLPMLTSAASVCAYLGDTRRAKILFEDLKSEAGRIVIAGIVTFWAGPIDRYLGLLAESLDQIDEAEQYLASAVRDSERAGARLIEAATMLDYARILRRRKASGDTQRAEEVRTRALAIYRDLGVQPEDPAIGPGPSGIETSDADEQPVGDRFIKGDRGWLVEFEGRRIQLPDSRGLVYLQHLLSTPDEDVHVIDLITPNGLEQAPIRIDRSSPGLRTSKARASESRIEMLDPTARRAYRDRLTELSRLQEEASRDQDLARLEALGNEREQIESELSTAFGLAGRARAASDPTERARKAVYNRIRASIKRIGGVHPELGRHFERSIHTGTTCSYRPGRTMSWVLD